MGIFSDDHRVTADARPVGRRSPTGAGPRSAPATMPRARRASRQALAPRGGFLRPGLHRRFVPLLIVLTLASSLGVAALAFFGARASAVTTAQAQATQNVRVLRQLLADQGAGITANNGRLVVGQDSAQLVLNGDPIMVDRAHDATGAYAAIYQLEGPNLVGVAGNVPITDAQGDPLPGTRLLGDTIGGPAYDALLGNCGAADTQDCHQSYSGVATLHGVSYVVAYAPLDDNSGAFVGALASAIPLDSVLAPVTQQAVLLVLVGLLLGMVALVAGYWIFDSGARAYFAAIDSQLDAVSAQAKEVSALARAQVVHATQQEQTAQQAGEQSRTLDAFAHAMEEDYAGLQSSASELWAEMSQPGAAADPARASFQARQTAVVAARVGTAAAQARDLCRHISMLMRLVIAQSHTVTDGSRELDLHATELQGVVAQAGATLAERLSMDSEQVRDARVRETGAVRTVTGQRAAVDGNMQRTGIHRTLASRPGQTGSVPNVRPMSNREQRASGEQPIYRPGMSRATGGFPTVPPTPLRGPQTPGHAAPFPMRSTDTPRRFPDTPSGFYDAASSSPQTPSRYPNAPSRVFGERSEPHGHPSGARRTGEWPATRPSSAADAPIHEQPARSSEPLNRLGLPDLSSQDCVPDWRDDESE